MFRLAHELAWERRGEREQPLTESDEQESRLMNGRATLDQLSTVPLPFGFAKICQRFFFSRPSSRELRVALVAISLLFRGLGDLLARADALW